MNLLGTPNNGANSSASRNPAESSMPSFVNTAPNSEEQAPSTRAFVKQETQFGQRNRLASGAANSKLVEDGTDTSREVPQIRVQPDHYDGFATTKEGGPSWLSRKTSRKSTTRPRVDNVFQGITLDIPSGGLSEELFTNEMKFSQRGSVLVDGNIANQPLPASARNTANTAAGKIVGSSPSLRASAPAKVLSMDEETLSQKVRMFYEVGSELPHDADGGSSLGRRMGLRWQDALAGHDGKSTSSISRATSNSDIHSVASSTRQRAGSTLESPLVREEHELAGGIEDWQDLEHEDIDRYGFIVPRSATSNPPSSSGIARSPSARDAHTLHRVSTTLQIASETPRRKQTIRRSPSSAHGTGGASADPGVNRQTSGHSSIRPTSSQSAYHGSIANRNSSLRSASNRLPHNKGRRLMDEASDMLTLPPGLAGMTENGDRSSSGSGSARLKETQRERKWQNMARVVSKGPHGSGMVFDFDTSSPKLIERTWKGIPDRWRATAWYAFLSASAKKRKDSLSDDDLVDAYHEYLTKSSPDDVQIDIDVPRTISSHIMFRRRYRGGQRLLFHVLHAMSLHFAATGYVQGMAALAATLLAYYEEERAFVMLARLWDLRGLNKLYKEGFGGLMAALDNFEKHWLGQGEIAGKLNELNIAPTAYGTRWYLTLFNYSIPFPAQLRVWDVFMLLGDDDQNGVPPAPSDSTNFGTTLDILHATSAALIDGMRDILLESDFETAMKTLTSWIPIKDEDLFMRVTKAEYKTHKRRG